MINTGMNFGFTPFAGMQAAASSADAPAQSAQHMTANPTNTAAAPMPAAMPMMMAPMATMSPAYMMAYPQMAAGFGAGMNALNVTGAGAAEAAAGEASHVTANPTNSLAQPQGGMPGAYGGYAGMGMPMLGGFSMPVMVMMPVFIAYGIPMAYPGGGQAQPPVDGNSGAAPDVPDAVEAASVDVPDTPEQVIPNGQGAQVDVVPPGAAESDEDSPTLPIVQMDAAEFSRYRTVDKSAQLETSLTMELTTRDGDVISLDFSQIDSMSSQSIRGLTLDGERVDDLSFDESTERVVNMSVDGDLSAAEQAAIDTVLSSIVASVQQFFTGNVGESVAQLKAMDFDSEQLAELSLNMSMNKSAQVSKAYQAQGGPARDAVERNADAAQVLEFLASEQKRLIDVAKEVLEAPSAAKLVRTLVPPLLADPFAQLRSQVAETGPSAADEGQEVDGAERKSFDVSEQLLSDLADKQAFAAAG